VRVDSTGWYATRIECSVPRVLFGHNGRLIEDQQQFDSALNKLHEALLDFMHIAPIEEWCPWRLDFAWNYLFPFGSAALMEAHSHLILPGLRNAPIQHIRKGDKGISWLGAKSRMKVILYHKSKQMKVPGDVSRGEISLSGEMLARYLKGRNWRDWRVLWSIYYEIMVSIPVIPKPESCGGWPEALALEPPEVQTRILARLTHMSRPTIRRYKRRIDAAAAGLPETFSWARVLSPEGPPKAVHVEPRRARTPTSARL
jgi:hypothetical protein